MSDLPKRPRSADPEGPTEAEPEEIPPETPTPTEPESNVVPPVPPPPPPVSVPSDEVAEWQKRYQYLLADFDNFRRRVERDRQAAVEAARGRILLRTIDLHDGIEGTVETLPAEAKDLKEGLTLVLKNFDQLLKDERVETVAAVGMPFDPEVHEAVGQVESNEKLPDGTIATIVQQGYRGPLGLMRPAKVIVAQAPSESSGAAEEPSGE